MDRVLLDVLDIGHVVLVAAEQITGPEEVANQLNIDLAFYPLAVDRLKGQHRDVVQLG